MHSDEMVHGNRDTPDACSLARPGGLIHKKIQGFVEQDEKSHLVSGLWVGPVNN